jgi:DNA invertase Pin-like site-specific DNA recombinase
MKRVALHLRVSTDQQTVENQRLQLEEVAARHDWVVVATFSDQGISGAKGRDRRPGFDALCKAVARREIDMVAAVAVDRLGRSLQDLVSFLADLHAKGVDLFLLRQGLDTSSPSGRMLFQMLAVFSEFERSLIQARVTAGLERARAQGRRLGRPPLPEKVKEQVRALNAAGTSKNKIAKRLKIGYASVDRILAEPGPQPVLYSPVPIIS